MNDTLKERLLALVLLILFLVASFVAIHNRAELNKANKRVEVLERESMYWKHATNFWLKVKKQREGHNAEEWLAK